MGYDLLLILLGCIFGIFISKIRDQHLSKKSMRIAREEINSIFKNVLDNITNGKTVFHNRMNNNVTIKTKLDTMGDISIIYLMDRQDIAIFKEDKCIYTSDLVDGKLVESIIINICVFFKNEMKDIVNLMGIIYYRPDFEKRFNIKIDDIKKGLYGEGIAELSDVNKIIKDNESKFNIDSILDKINTVGIEGLTDDERKFLDNYDG